jgi:hypothetical protein
MGHWQFGSEKQIVFEREAVGLSWVAALIAGNVRCPELQVWRVYEYF